MNARPRFKPYPAYKDSGVEWLSVMPAHWRITKMWDVTDAISGGTPTKEAGHYWEGTIPWVSAKDMKRRHLDASEDFISEAAVRETGLKMIPPGSVLIVVRGMILAHTFPVGISTVPLTINQDLKALHLREELDCEFFAYWLEGVGSQLLDVVVEKAAHGTKAIRMDRWRVMPVEVPPKDEQRAIARFVERETAKIDALVAKKKRLIELLQEKRAALITRAVTKGLDQTVPMKDSAVDLLAKIPTHWEVRPFTKYVVEKSDYRGKTPEKVASGVFLVTARNVRMGLIDYECSQEFVAEDEYDEIMRRGLLKIGDILFTTEAPLGNVALVDREDVALAQRIIRFRMNTKHFDSRFTLYAMMSDYFQAQLLTLSTGSTAEGLKASKLPMLYLVGPLLTEQRAISAFLDLATTRIECLVAEVRNAIDRLKELRTALISAAVTGKIDVREEAA